MILADLRIEWSVHLPLIIHSAVLGLDSTRTLFYEHCKQLLMNVIVAYTRTLVPIRDVAAVLLANQLSTSQPSLTSSSIKLGSVSSRFGTISSQSTMVITDQTPLTNTTSSSSTVDSRADTPALSTMIGSGGGCSTPSLANRQLIERVLLHDAETDRFQSLPELVVALTVCLSDKYVYAI
jgi:hypothetical protein